MIYLDSIYQLPCNLLRHILELWTKDERAVLLGLGLENLPITVLHSFISYLPTCGSKNNPGSHAKQVMETKVMSGRKPGP